MNQRSPRASRKLAAVPGQLFCPTARGLFVGAGGQNKGSLITGISLDIYSSILTDLIRVFLQTALVGAVILGWSSVQSAGGMDG